MVTLQSVLIVIIILITINLLFVGFYIVMVLREVKKTVSKAGAVIDEVDRTVKDGIEKAEALEAPMQALAATTAALTGIIKGARVIGKATSSIWKKDAASAESDDSPRKKRRSIRPKFFRKK